MNLQSYSHGKFLVNQDLHSHKLTENWIRNKQFLRYEISQLLLDRKVSGKRNKLYCFNHNCVQCDVVMKVSWISPDYKFRRKVDLFVASLIKSYNYRSYIGSMKMQKAGIETIEPIAYWTYRPSLLHRKSYFLYKKINCELTVEQLSHKIISSNVKNKDLLIQTIVDRCIDIVKDIHKANMRHDDLHGNNILTDIKCGDVATLDEKKIESAKFTLIDNERCTFARATIPSIKQFFDLKCLVKFQVCNPPQKELLHQYLGEKYRAYWWYVLCFWRSGGFSIRKHVSNLLKWCTDRVTHT